MHGGLKESAELSAAEKRLPKWVTPVTWTAVYDSWIFWEQKKKKRKTRTFLWREFYLFSVNETGGCQKFNKWFLQIFWLILKTLTLAAIELKESKMDVFRSNDNEFLFNLCFVLKVILFAERNVSEVKQRKDIKKISLTKSKTKNSKTKKMEIFLSLLLKRISFWCQHFWWCQEVPQNSKLVLFSQVINQCGHYQLFI